MAFVLFVRSISKHDLGLEIIKKHELWKVALVKSKRTIYLVRECGNLMYDILARLEEVGDIITCRMVIKQMVTPFILGVWFNPGDSVTVDDRENNLALQSALDNLERILIKITEANRPTMMIYNLLVTNQLSKKLVTSTLSSYDPDYSKKVRRCLVYSNVLQYTLMTIPAEDKETEAQNYRRFSIAFFNSINHCMQRRHCYDVLMITELYSYLWNKINIEPSEEETEGRKFGDQLLAVQLLPVLYAIRKCSEPAQYVEDYLNKVFSSSCEQTIRHLYAFREAIDQAQLKAELANKAVTGLVAMSTYLGRERAILAFQALIYILVLYVPDLNDITYVNPCGIKKRDMILHGAKLLGSILTGLTVFISKYNFSWNDCLDAT